MTKRTVVVSEPHLHKLQWLPQCPPTPKNPFVRDDIDVAYILEFAHYDLTEFGLILTGYGSLNTEWSRYKDIFVLDVLSYHEIVALIS